MIRKNNCTLIILFHTTSRNRNGDSYKGIDSRVSALLVRYVAVSITIAMTMTIVLVF